jgi:hypothetical protein
LLLPRAKSEPMFTIRANQLAIMSAASHQRFARNAVARLREIFPKETEAMGDPEMMRRVEAGIALGEARGIRREKDVQGFLELQLHLGGELGATPDVPWVHAILQDRRRSAEERLENIYGELLARHAGS